MKKTSIKTAILIPVLSILVIGIAIMVIVLGATVTASTSNLTDDLINASVNEYANSFEALGNHGYAVVTTLANVIESIQQNSENPREEIVELFQEILRDDDSILALWTGWEPNAFDGKDSEFVNANEYHDDTGRYVPFVFRDGNRIGLDPLLDYDHPVDGLYYQGPKTSGRENITDPYPYDVGGRMVPIYSIGIPIIQNGSVVGVAGIDVSLEAVTAIMNSGSILEDGYYYVLSPSGLVTSHRDENLLLQEYKTTWIGNYSSDIDSLLANGGISVFPLILMSQTQRWSFLSPA